MPAATFPGSSGILSRHIGRTGASLTASACSGATGLEHAAAHQASIAMLLALSTVCGRNLACNDASSARRRPANLHHTRATTLRPRHLASPREANLAQSFSARWLAPSLQYETLPT